MCNLYLVFVLESIYFAPGPDHYDQSDDAQIIADSILFFFSSTNSHILQNMIPDMPAAYFNIHDFHPQVFLIFFFSFLFRIQFATCICVGMSDYSIWVRPLSVVNYYYWNCYNLSDSLLRRSYLVVICALCNKHLHSLYASANSENIVQIENVFFFLWVTPFTWTTMRCSLFGYTVWWLDEDRK